MASRQLAASLLDTAGALNPCVDLGLPHLKAERTQPARRWVLLEWAGEAAQLHAKGKLFVTEMKITDRGACPL